MSDKTLRFTMKRLEALEPAAERYVVRDTGQPGLVLRISLVVGLLALV